MISSTQLDGIALVVGSGRGICKEAVLSLAFSLAFAGAKAVVFADMDESAAAAASEESKQYASNPYYQTITFKMNVQEAQSVQDMVDFVVKEYGRLDYCVNGVGAAAMRKQEPKTWTLRSGTRDIGRGVIVNVASANSFTGLAGKEAGKPSRSMLLWGLLRWRSLYGSGAKKLAGLDHAPEGIHVVAVCPTYVRTPLLDVELEKNPEVQRKISAITPIKWAAECDEVSDVIALLCSPAASYITGTGLLIDAAVTTTVCLYWKAAVGGGA
ncbi:NAD(P)-binding protein [Lentithecium fluviatile CBS 122367]|uniref:3-oxoacyl-[acyl-carrier-protein] reductase n=1 Tax=Lentithecium fluviatile CBS 122367 TaxID=1168545 RepID=A0A6G1IF07_9PLEO|nr:NAD(P)-binding protein [Lentithecium fluviatile CBS 122367]